MRVASVLFLALSLSLLFGCSASQQNISLEAQNPAIEEPDDGTLCLIMPADGPVFSDYGARRRFGKNKKKYRMHTGIDIAAKRGSDVVAASGGTVIFSGRQNGYGKTVKIDHGNDRVTLYAHMGKVFVFEGQTLAQGERLGEVGRTGRTTGAHLHFELHIDGRHTDPVPKGGWTEPELNIATAAAPAETIVPPVTAAATDEAAMADADASPELAVAPDSKPANPILAFFRKITRPSSDSAQTAEETQQPAS